MSLKSVSKAGQQHFVVFLNCVCVCVCACVRVCVRVCVCVNCTKVSHVFSSVFYEAPPRI